MVSAAHASGVLVAVSLVGFASLGAQMPAKAAKITPPHIVLILADDLGWTDLSTGRTNFGHGSPYYETPNLDALAAAGACFVNAYSNGPNCAPTRAAIWSGQWGTHTGIYTVGSGNRGKPQHRQLDAADNHETLPASVVTLAETLHAAGYATGHFGKWHLGDHEHAVSPTDQGFDHQAGGDHRGGVGGLGHFADEHGAFALPGLPANGKAKQFLADRLTDEAIAWMRDRPKPMFCCISHYSVHTPIAAPPADLAATAAAAEGLRHQNRRYKAMLKNLDDTCGRVFQFLAATDDPMRPGEKLLANTVLVFTSDNGGLGGYRAAGIAGATEVTNQLPLRSGKGSLFEGGTRVPFVVRWDGHVLPGATDATPVQLFDLYPTLAAMAGAELPTEQPVHGIDLSPRLQPKPQALPERALFWHFPGYLEANARQGTWRTAPASSIRRGNLKAVFWYETRTWSLFDLAADLNEAHDLAAERVQALRPLASELVQWLRTNNAPLPKDLAGGAVALPAIPQ